jgi:DNA-binding MarR family transcriptional regulator
MYGARMGSHAASALAVDEASGYRTAVTGELVDEVMRFVRILKASVSSAPGLDKASLLLLWPLQQEGPKRLRDLAEAKGVDQSTVSRQAAQLVKVGLVSRDPDPADRRACLLALTDRGREVCEELTELRRRGFGEALAGWEDDRIGEFAVLFRDFNHAVEQHAAASHADDSHAAHSHADPGHAVDGRTADSLPAQLHRTPS